MNPVKITPENLKSIEAIKKSSFETIQFGGDFYHMLYSKKIAESFTVPARPHAIDVIQKGKYIQMNKQEEGVGYYWQCVCFVKALCQLTVGTKTWGKWEQISKSTQVERGTLIATFFWSNSTYSWHTGIYLWNYTNPITKESGIYILDQNWLENSSANDGTVGIHKIAFNKKTNILNAGNYFVVSL